MHRDEGLIEEPQANRYRYAWGKTGRVEKALREVFTNSEVIKAADEESGLRTLQVDDLMFFEARSPFPLAEDIGAEQQDFDALDEICEQLGIVSPEARNVVSTLIGMNKAKKTDIKANTRSIKRFLTMLQQGLQEGTTLDAALVEVEGRGLLQSMAAGDLTGNALKELTKMRGVPQVSANPGLVAFAHELAANTDILQSTGWQSARTDEEFSGLLGEYIAQAEIDSLMPQGPEDGLEQDAEVLQLHSVHFVGDLYKDDALQRANTDVCSELDLMSVVATPEGAYEYFALGNIKVTKSSANAAAQAQNDIAQVVVDAHIGNARADIDTGKNITADVKRVYGHSIPGNQVVELTGKLAKGGAVTKLTIGASDKGVHGYDKLMTMSYKDISMLALLLREIEAQRANT